MGRGSVQASLSGMGMVSIGARLRGMGIGQSRGKIEELG